MENLLIADLRVVDADCPGERCKDAVLMDPRANPSLKEVVKALFNQELATRPATEYVEETMEAGDRANTYS
jgi:hypothetical protein